MILMIDLPMSAVIDSIINFCYKSMINFFSLFFPGPSREDNMVEPTEDMDDLQSPSRTSIQVKLPSAARHSAASRSRGTLSPDSRLSTEFKVRQNLSLFTHWRCAGSFDPLKLLKGTCAVYLL